MEQAGTAERVGRAQTEPVPTAPPTPEPVLPTAAGSDPAEPRPTPTEQSYGRVETPETVATDAGRQFRGLRFALGVVVAIAVTVILTAINVQSGRILDREGHGWSFRVLFGPDVLSGTNLQGWRVVSETGQLSDPDRYAYLLRLFTAADLAFIVVYFFLLRAVITTIARGFWLKLGSWALLALVAFDLIENALSWPGLLDPPPVVIVLATTLKWLALLVVVGSVVLSAVTSPRRLDSERSVASRLRRTGKAVMHQRFSYVPVVVLFILSVPSGAALLEQLPDALRRWISDGWVGVRQAVLSMLCTLGLGAFLIVAGRYRTGYAFRHPDPPPKRPLDEGSPYLWVWLVGPVVAVAGAVIALATLHGEDILVLRLFAFLLLPVVVIIGSRLLRRRWARHPDEYREDRSPTFDERELTAVRLAGTIAGPRRDRGRRAEPAPRVRAPAAGSEHCAVGPGLAVPDHRRRGGDRSLAGGHGLYLADRRPADQRAGGGPPALDAEQPEGEDPDRQLGAAGQCGRSVRAPGGHPPAGRLDRPGRDRDPGHRQHCGDAVGHRPVDPGSAHRGDLPALPAAPLAAGHPAGPQPGAGRPVRGAGQHPRGRPWCPGGLGGRHPADHGRLLRRLARLTPAVPDHGRRPAGPPDAAGRRGGRRDPRRVLDRPRACRRSTTPPAGSARPCSPPEPAAGRWG